MHNRLLAKALDELHRLQQSGSVFKSSDFSGKNMTYLKKAGYLKSVIRGWYYQSHPGEHDGDTTTWYAGFWEFVSKYLSERFGQDYCLNPEVSLLLHTRYSVIPKQIVAVTKSGSVGKVTLLHDNSIFIYPEKKSFPADVETYNGLNIYTLEESLCKVGPLFFKENQKEVEIAISMIKDVSGVLKILLVRKRMDDTASRISGAFHFLGREAEARRIKEAYETATFKNVSLISPFLKETPTLQFTRERNPYALRLKSMWNSYRDMIIELIGRVERPSSQATVRSVMVEMDEKYRHDAYHSLSIEGYKVSLGLIERVASGVWDPELDGADGDTRNALAVKGYYQAFEAVKATIVKAIETDSDMVTLLRDEHHRWYSELFAPSVQSGILEAHHLAGYRDSQVYLRGSSHVPFPKEAIVDAMEVYFELLQDEENTFVKTILGHHLFGFIHPYMDGNGRMARLIMNAILVSDGLPWLIIELDDRKAYMTSLEEASVNGDIGQFAEFILKYLPRYE